MFDIKNVSEIKGYHEITINQEMFKKFITNFINGWGMDARETIQPLSVKYVQDAEGKYLKFVYEMYERKEWLHVTSPYNWY